MAYVAVLAYCGAILLEPLNRLYFVPCGQTDDPAFHYVDCNTGDIKAYPSILALGTQYGAWAYHGDGAYARSVQRIYLAPHGQGDNVVWHYIDMDGVKEYSAPSPVTRADAYMGATWSAVLNRVYFAPWGQSYLPSWHYVDTSTTAGTVYTYPAVNNGYIYESAIYAPALGRVYFIPRNDIIPASTVLGYVSNTGVFTHYSLGLTVDLNHEDYLGAVLSPKQQRIYFVPFNSHAKPEWHYLYVGCKCATGYEQPDGTCVGQ
jgi:hypothetical protein